MKTKLLAAVLALLGSSSSDPANATFNSCMGAMGPIGDRFAERPSPVPVRPRAAGELSVGTLNLFRLFDDADDPAGFTAQGTERDDAVVGTAEYLRRRAKLASYILDVLDAPDILAVQEAEKLEVLEDLAAEIARVDASVVYQAYLEEGNDRGSIDIGFLVRDSVVAHAVTQLGKHEILTFDGSLLNDRPPLLLQARFALEFGSFPIRVLTIHNRSLRNIDDASDGPRVRRKRLEQAQSVARKVQALQTADPDVHLVVIGDFNAFEFSDGFVDVVGHIAGDFDPANELVCEVHSCEDLVDPNLTNQVLSLPSAQRYSFVFQGRPQALDHALTSVALDGFVTGVEFGRGNAGAPLDLTQDATTPMRSSDHDGLVLLLAADADGDGFPDDVDACPGTEIPESVPTGGGLGSRRWALVDGDTRFDTPRPAENGRPVSFTTGDTAGCSCEQIIAALDLGGKHSRKGCTTGTMKAWVDSVRP